MKADGQVHGAYQAPPPVAASQGPVAAPGQPDSSMAGGIKALVQALAQAFAPKAITQRKQKVDTDVAEATGDQSSLGNQF
jgi:hypothetical protein